MTRKWCLTERVYILLETADLWIGAYWDRQKGRLYILPVPCFGIVIELAVPAERQPSHGEGGE